MTLTESPPDNSLDAFKMSHIIVTIIAFVAVYYIYKIVIYPLLRMSFYRKQGLPLLYFPALGSFYYRLKDLNAHNDFYYTPKFEDKKFEKRAICSNFGSKPCLILYDVALIREFYLHPENYTRDPEFIDITSILEGQGLFIVEGNQWKTQRKILSSSFNFDFLKSILADIQKISRRTFKDLQQDSLKEVDITTVFQQITAEVMGSTFFGEKVNNYRLEGGESLTRALAEIMTEMGNLIRSPIRLIFGSWIVRKGIFPSHAEYLRKVKGFRDTCAKIVEQRRKQHDTRNSNTQYEKPKDMIELLLDYKGAESKIPTEKIIDEFITFYAGGTDTTSHLLTMIIIQYLGYPEAGARMLEEVKNLYDSDKDITIDDLNKLEYLTAFIKETFRTMTPAPLIASRIAIKDHKIHELMIRKGDLIHLEFFYNHYNPKYFEDPESFKPERWLSKTSAIDAYAFTPFSAGPRNCIGQHLAMNEARIILCEFLRTFDLQLKDNYKLRLGFKFMYAPLDPFLVNLKPKMNN